MDVAKILWMSLVKHSVCQSFTSNIDCIFNFSLKQVVLAWFNRKGRETEEKWWSNMPNNFRCLISNASGLIIQATSQYTALDIFQRSLRWLQRQPAQELIALPGLYCASRGKQDNKAGSPWDMVVSEAVSRTAFSCLKCENAPSPPASLCLYLWQRLWRGVSLV